VIEKITSAAIGAEAERALGEELMEDLEEAATGPIALAMNVNETPAEDTSA
jgi:hypothetical protein